MPSPQFPSGKGPEKGQESRDDLLQTSGVVNAAVMMVVMVVMIAGVRI